MGHSRAAQCGHRLDSETIIVGLVTGEILSLGLL